MDQSIFDRGLGDYSGLRVLDMKGLITVMAVNLVLQFVMQGENIILQIIFKLHDIRLAPFTTLEFIPAREHILQTN
jgi:hypothetical protein